MPALQNMPSNSNIPKVIQKKLKTEVEIASPNLIPKYFRETLYLDAALASIKKVGKFGFLFTIFLWLAGGLFLFSVKNQIDELKTSSGSDSEKVGELEKMKESKKELRIIGNKIEKSFEKEYAWSKFLSELSSVAPPKIILNSIETLIAQPGWIKISGIAEVREDFLLFKDRLEKSKLCEKVESPLSNYVNPKSLQFEINVKLLGWKPIWEEDIKKQSAAGKKVQKEEE